MMTRRSRLWLIAASLFTLVNVGGALWALVNVELTHAATHAALILLGSVVVWRLVSRADVQHATGTRETEQRLAHLQRSLDAIAVEVDRIGEAQRFTAKRVAEAAAVPIHERPVRQRDDEV
jgi:hypothetical protein